MSNNMNKVRKFLTDGRIALLLVVLILVVDQLIKLSVKTNMRLGDMIRVTQWFYIDFVENNGMAYGMTFVNKLFLSLFRIVAVGFIGWYLYKVLHRQHRLGYVLCLSMILAGAAGNIFDSMFYGIFFTESTPYDVAQIVGPGQGYAPFLEGKVVDMFYFPLIVTHWPQWVPVWGGEQFIFFSPVFNFADANISVGVILLLLFFRKDLENVKPQSKEDGESAVTDAVEAKSHEAKSK